MPLPLPDVDRRRLLRAAAWTAPAIAVTGAAPAFAASPNSAWQLNATFTPAGVAARARTQEFNEDFDWSWLTCYDVSGVAGEPCLYVATHEGVAVGDGHVVLTFVGTQSRTSSDALAHTYDFSVPFVESPPTATTVDLPLTAGEVECPVVCFAGPVDGNHQVDLVAHLVVSGAVVATHTMTFTPRTSS